jgi:hypothetical protein
MGAGMTPLRVALSALRDGPGWSGCCTVHGPLGVAAEVHGPQRATREHALHDAESLRAVALQAAGMMMRPSWPTATRGEA